MSAPSKGVVPSARPDAGTGPEAILRDAATALRDALLAERSALDAKDAQALASLSAEKRRRVLALERALAGRGGRADRGVSGDPFARSALSSSDPTAALLRECRDLNATNATGVAMRLATVRSALVRLARLSGADEAWGYSADGAPVRPVRGRTLGEG